MTSPSKRWLLAPVIAVLLTTAVLAIEFPISVPDSEHLVMADGITDTEAESAFQCTAFEQSGKAIDDEGRIDVLVWNIYKQNKDDWQSELTKLLNGKQLGLLQEVSFTDEFKAWLYQLNWVGQQVKAFESFDVSAGVFNITQVYPIRACAQLDAEPWIQIPKSALFATYPLSNGEVLAVGNLHGINFTFGTEAYSKQLKLLASKLEQHNGPVILGGDFNTWSDARLEQLTQIMSSANLEEVVFEPDQRTEFMGGHVLDHIYYRGLNLKKAEAPTSDASDHNPMLASFSIAEIKR
ncbi:endonuclease/exonuclease/phosphatase family protein [Vibrio comitans]|uniref:UPF0294 protein n=1 Tax=Vibrio comitans NBRC 102076 TaxID=1219078 RepID=A0A4Y3IKJ0_9VIBR|nr:endonuclease/exonuclease/phosphatase family protein [Vibrio comitans]GEA59522.1 UPF0294 protein [Vibrio comitans NBRC 102076]